jgi:hypothetical protein
MPNLMEELEDWQLLENKRAHGVRFLLHATPALIYIDIVCDPFSRELLVYFPL